MSILHPEQLHIMSFFPFPCLPPLTKLPAPFTWIATKIILRLLYPVLSLPPHPFFESQSDLLKCNLRNFVQNDKLCSGLLPNSFPQYTYQDNIRIKSTTKGLSRPLDRLLGPRRCDVSGVKIYIKMYYCRI